MVITSSPDFLFLKAALSPPCTEHNFDKVFTDNTGLAAATDGARAHIIHHGGLLVPHGLYSALDMGRGETALIYSGVDKKVHMWDILYASMVKDGLIPLPVCKVPAGRYNPNYFIPGGIAYLPCEKRGYLLIESGNRLVIVLPG